MITHSRRHTLNRVAAKDSFKFIVIGDSQRFYDELRDFVANVNQRKDVSFIVLNGDITDFGLNKEYKWINRELSRLNIPYLAVIGNHDMLANGSLLYKQMFGAENFSFHYGETKFICLNSSSREKGFDGSLPDLDWLKTELKDLSRYRNAFVISHVPPFHKDFDKTLAAPYNNALVESKKIRLSIHGHDHNYSTSHPYGSEIEYLVSGTINKRSYSLISVTDDDYEIEKVEY